MKYQLIFKQIRQKCKRQLQKLRYFAILHLPSSGGLIAIRNEIYSLFQLKVLILLFYVVLPLVLEANKIINLQKHNYRVLQKGFERNR